VGKRFSKKHCHVLLFASLREEAEVGQYAQPRILIQSEGLIEPARLCLNKLSGKGQTAQNTLLALTETKNIMLLYF
jgi:hypothetical protein